MLPESGWRQATPGCQAGVLLVTEPFCEDAVCQCRPVDMLGC